MSNKTCKELLRVIKVSPGCCSSKAARFGGCVAFDIADLLGHLIDHHGIYLDRHPDHGFTITTIAMFVVLLDHSMSSCECSE